MIRRILGWSGAAFIMVGTVMLMTAGPTAMKPLTGGVHAVPSLTAWGKIFSILLLAALGVAYLVWRRPVMQARAILETSPLGSRQTAVTLVDWPLFIKTLFAFEAASLLGVWLFARFVRQVTTLDTLGVVGCAVIAAFVVHLLILGWRKG